MAAAARRGTQPQRPDIDRSACRRRQVDPAGSDPVKQIIGRDVDQFDLFGQINHAVGNCLADDDARDLADDVIEALDVLDVERGPDIDPRSKEVVDILPPLVVEAAGGIGVREFVDEQDGRTCGST